MDDLKAVGVLTWKLNPSKGLELEDPELIKIREERGYGKPATLSSP
jgi:hypothetical protein